MVQNFVRALFSNRLFTSRGLLSNIGMITGRISEWRKLPGFVSNPVWTRAFEWLEKEAPKASDGLHELGGEGFTVNIVTRPLKKRLEAKFETHARTIDIHLTLEGAETIELESTGKLQPLGDYNSKTDAQFYVRPEYPFCRIENHAGSFAVILPGEAHMPVIELPGFTTIRKAIVKLPVKLLETS
jgi:biofilm protein TabA